MAKEDRDNYPPVVTADDPDEDDLLPEFPKSLTQQIETALFDQVLTSLKAGETTLGEGQKMAQAFLRFLPIPLDSQLDYQLFQVLQVLACDWPWIEPVLHKFRPETDADLIIGRDMSSKDVILPASSRSQGLYVIGKSGAGKSTLLSELILQDINNNQGVCVIDPHGDLITTILERGGMLRLSRDFVLLDAGNPDVAFGLNVLTNNGTPQSLALAADRTVQLFKRVWGDSSWGPRLEDLLYSTAYTLAYHQLTLAEADEFLYEQKMWQRLGFTVPNESIVRYWTHDYDRMNDRDRREVRSSVLNKLRGFLSNPLLNDIVRQKENTVDWRRAMDMGKVVLVRLALADLGDGPVTLLGGTIVGQILEAAISRAGTDKRPPFAFYCDEYHRFATPAFATLLEEARKYGVCLTIAHQRRAQLDSAHRSAPLGAWNLVAFNVIPEDASELAGTFDHTPPEPQIIGRRAKLVVTADPVRELMKSPPDHEVLRQLSDSMIAPLVERIEQLSSSAVSCVETPYGEFVTDRAALQSGISEINRLFVARMQQGAAFDDRQHLMKILEALRGWLWFETEQVERYGKWELRTPRLLSNELYRASVSIIVGLKVELPNEVFEPAFERSVKILTSDLLNDGRTIDDPAADFTSMLDTVLFEAPDGRTRDSYRTQQQIDWRVHWFRYWSNELYGFHLLGKLLAAMPLKTEGPEYDPIYDKPRTYSDMEGEIANQLSTLPPYTAKARIRGTNGMEEHTIIPFVDHDCDEPLHVKPAGKRRDEFDEPEVTPDLPPKPKPPTKPAVFLDSPAPPPKTLPRN